MKTTGLLCVALLWVSTVSRASSQGLQCDEANTAAACGVQFGDTTYMLEESAAASSIMIYVTKPSDTRFDVEVISFGGTATQSDFTVTPTTIQFDRFQTSAPVRILIRDDSEVEDQEHFFLAFRSVSASTHTMGRNVITKVVINDNDFAPQLEKVEKNARVWFSNQALRRPIEVRILGVGRKCESVKVAFRPLDEGGKVAPDTARGVQENGQCMARTVWQLGKRVGLQTLEARLGNSTTTVNAKARHAARIVVGLIAAMQWARRDFVPRRDTVRVTRSVPDVSTGGSVDSTSTEVFSPLGDTTAARKIAFRADAWAGVSSPLVPQWTWLRLVAGTSVLDPGGRFYFGFHVLHLAWWELMESTPVDLAVGVSFRRQTKGRESVVDCMPAPAPCKHTTWWPPEFFLGVTIDAASTLGALGRLFAP